MSQVREQRVMTKSIDCISSDLLILFLEKKSLEDAINRSALLVQTFCSVTQSVTQQSEVYDGPLLFLVTRML